MVSLRGLQGRPPSGSRAPSARTSASSSCGREGSGAGAAHTALPVLGAAAERPRAPSGGTSAGRWGGAMHHGSGLCVLPPKALAGTDRSPGRTSDPERSLGLPCWPGKTRGGLGGVGGGGWGCPSRGLGLRSRAGLGSVCSFHIFSLKKTPWHVFIYFVIKVK